jgi:hypothetical protein
MEVPALNPGRKFRVKKKLKWILAALLVVFGLLQFFQPDRTHPPEKTDFLAVMAPSPRVATMFRTSCYDCHSYETRWPWYSRISPMSWAIARDVYYGRENLNFSEWPTNRPAWVAKKFESMNEDIQYGDMPLPKYTLIHRDARLTQAQRKELEDWLNTKTEQLNVPAEAQ